MDVSGILAVTRGDSALTKRSRDRARTDLAVALWSDCALFLFSTKLTGFPAQFPRAVEAGVYLLRIDRS